MTGTSRVQEQHQDDLLLNSQVARSCSCGHSSSRWNYRPRPLSTWLFFFSTYTSGIVLNALSVATACRCGHKLHKTVILSMISFNLHTMHATYSHERNYYIPSWHRKLAGVSRHIFLSLSLLPVEIKKIWLARKTNLDHACAHARPQEMHTTDLSLGTVQVVMQCSVWQWVHTFVNHLTSIISLVFILTPDF